MRDDRIEEDPRFDAPTLEDVAVEATEWAIASMLNRIAEYIQQGATKGQALDLYVIDDAGMSVENWALLTERAESTVSGQNSRARKIIRETKEQEK